MDDLDTVEGDGADRHDLAGGGSDDPLGGADGDADVAVVVHGDGTAVEDEVTGVDGFAVLFDGPSALGAADECGRAMMIC